MTHGYVIYNGPSMLTGAPIVLIATMASRNSKTGDMVQTWIFDQAESPSDTNKKGNDTSICGDCPLRGVNGKDRGCYVNLYRGPNAIWKAWKDRKYDICPTMLVFKGRRAVRLGAYGDPAAVPIQIWRDMVAASPGWTAYTHQWETCDERFKEFCMASVETHEQYWRAKSMGWRTFRITQDPEDILSNEIWCPATPEGGNNRQCATCRACSGTRFKKIARNRDIVAMAHGIGAKYIKTKELV